MGCDILFPFMEGSFFFFRKKLLDFSSFAHLDFSSLFFRYFGMTPVSPLKNVIADLDFT